MKQLLIAVLLCGATIEAEITTYTNLEQAKQNCLQNYGVSAWEVASWEVKY